MYVNDSLTGDPLMTVPIHTDPNVNPGDDISSICYEVHGESNAYFNLISDACTSVNAFYEAAVTPSPDIDLNVVTKIGVRAVGETTCIDIEVVLNLCTTLVDGITVASSYHADGISVKRYASSSRVRIAVPNCADTMLVMWVFCMTGQVPDPVGNASYSVDFIRFIVMRGLNLDEESHGLIGMTALFTGMCVSPVILCVRVACLSLLTQLSLG